LDLLIIYTQLFDIYFKTIKTYNENNYILTVFNEILPKSNINLNKIYFNLPYLLI